LPAARAEPFDGVIPRNSRPDHALTLATIAPIGVASWCSCRRYDVSQKLGKRRAGPGLWPDGAFLIKEVGKIGEAHGAKNSRRRLVNTLRRRQGGEAPRDSPAGALGAASCS